MSLDVLRLPGATNRIAPVEPRLALLFCFALLTAGCALASFALACATPFAAYAVIAAAMLPLPAALLVVTAAWLVNQAIGFGVLAYPHTVNTLLWGLAISIAALAATIASNAVLHALPRAASPLALVLALAGAYGAYEIALFAFTPTLGGAGAFTVAIISRLGLLNAVWLVALVAFCAAWRFAGNFRARHAAS